MTYAEIFSKLYERQKAGLIRLALEMILFSCSLFVAALARRKKQVS